MSDDNDTREHGHKLDTEACPPFSNLPIQPFQPVVIEGGREDEALKDFAEIAGAYTDEMLQRAMALVHAREAREVITADGGHVPPSIPEMIMVASWILTGRFDGE